MLFAISIANAQTVTWDGGGGNANWHNPLNWDTNAVPCNTCSVIIDGALVNISSSDTVKEIEVKNSSFFFITVTVTVTITVAVSFYFTDQKESN